MAVVNDFRLTLGNQEYVPIIIGGMGVHFSSPDLVLEAVRLGGIGHLSDAMVPFVSDKRYGTDFTKQKAERNKAYADGFDKTAVKFLPEHVKEAQRLHISATMNRKHGSGAVFVNVMEKLTMAEPQSTLKARLEGALDGGVEGITLSAGLHQGTLKLIEDHPRFRDAKIGVIVSSLRALRIFLRGADRVRRLPDYVVVEGPLAGGHLGFGEDWAAYTLEGITSEIVQWLRSEDLQIPVIAAGGVFTGGDAVRFLEMGVAGVQVATRFTVTQECGLTPEGKQKYFEASEEQVTVNCVSPTGYLMRMLTNSPCLTSNIKPQCEAFGYMLSKEGTCQYLDAYQATPLTSIGKKEVVKGKICLCYHFSKSLCWTCGHNVYRLKDTSHRKSDGSYQLLTAEHVFRDYQFSKDSQIALPAPEEVCQPAANL